MKKNKILKIITLTLALSSLSSIAAFADVGYWQQAGSNWYYKDTSTGKVETGWIQDDGYWFYLYGNGQMATNITIDGYYLSSTGAWTTATSSASSNSGTALIAQDFFGTHLIRNDIVQGQDDIEISNQLTNNNMSLSDSGKELLRSLSLALAQGRLTVDEANSQCIGKVVDGQYKITDIKYFDQPYTVSTGADIDTKVKVIKNSSLSNYSPSSSYKYDSYLAFSCFNERQGQWEAIRIVVELEAV